tara:strand:- start:1328 stop:1804 length:477 start_codon:yes stop_codon:yes gene_type:complete
MAATNSWIEGSKPDDIKARQDAFLALYAEVGSIRAASKELGVNRRTPMRWIENNVQGFKERFEDAKHNFREMLQDLAVSRVKDQGPKDNPVLLITLLNAHWADKYRPQTTVVDDTAKEVLSEMRKRFKDSKNTESEDTSTELTAHEQVENILKGKKGD